MSEGDVITIFSQFGEPVYVNLIRDKETGKSKGFAFLKYEDQRSTDLAVDNLGGASVLGRILKVDHTRYKRKDEEAEVGDNTNTFNNGNGTGNPEANDNTKSNRMRTSEAESEEDRRPLIKEERELAALLRDHDEDDPMKEYLIQEKKEEVEQALARLKKVSRKSEGVSQRHHHHHHRHRSQRDHGSDGGDRSQERRRKERRHRSSSRYRYD